MREDTGSMSGWHRGMMSRLSDAEEVVDFAPVGPQDRPEAPDFTSIKLAHGYDSDVLINILGYRNYVILSAYVGDSGELMVDITHPERLHLFKI